MDLGEKMKSDICCTKGDWALSERVLIWRDTIETLGVSGLDGYKYVMFQSAVNRWIYAKAKVPTEVCLPCKTFLHVGKCGIWAGLKKKKNLGKLPHRLRCMSAVFADKRLFKFVSQVSFWGGERNVTRGQKVTQTVIVSLGSSQKWLSVNTAAVVKWWGGSGWTRIRTSQVAGGATYE